MRGLPPSASATAPVEQFSPPRQQPSTMQRFMPSLFSTCMASGDATSEFSLWEESRNFLKKLDEGCGASWDNKGRNKDRTQDRTKDKRSEKKKLSEPPQEEGPSLALRIAYAPGVESAGACLGPFGLGDDVGISELEPCKGFDMMRWRQGGSSSSSCRSPLLPRWGERFTAPHDFYRAKVHVSDGKDGIEDYWCLLSVATKAQDRSIEICQAAVDDAVTAASFAHRFNERTAKMQEEHGGGGEGAESVIGVRVCVPVACYIIGGHSEVAGAGEAVTLALYPYKTVQKYVFDGSEPFLELPQAFFHFCHHQSGGREVVVDLQGVEDEDGDIFIVDPVVIRPPPPTVGNLLGVLLQDPKAASEEQLRFDTWHPRCGQLCKAFDPTRKSAYCRRACGLAMPACGVGASG